jgi:hypothetical protein
VPDIAASGRPQENRITGRAGTVLSTPELAELDTYIAKSEYLADLAIECGFQDLAASVLRARTSDPARPRPVVGEGVCSAGRERAVNDARHGRQFGPQAQQRRRDRSEVIPLS